MVRTLEDAARLGRVGAAEAELLASPERPIVLLERLEEGPLAAGVAPGLGWVGVMLPTTPLHHPAARPGAPPAGHDQRQPERGADRHRQRGGARPAGRHRRRLPAPRPGDRVPLRRLGRPPDRRRPRPPAARARLRPASARPAGAEPGAVPGGGAAPQEHLHPGARPPGVREPAHRGPREPRDARAFPRVARAVQGALPHRAGGGRPRPASRILLDPGGTGVGVAGAPGGAAPPRPRRGGHGRARPHRAGARPRVRRRGVRGGRHRLGRGDPAGGPARLPPGGAPPAGAAPRRRPGGPQPLARRARLPHARPRTSRRPSRLRWTASRRRSAPWRSCRRRGA